MFTITLIAIADDFRRYKISNRIILLGMILGTGMIFADFNNIEKYLLGALVMFVLTFLLYLPRAIGGGDVKLLSVLGLILGIDNVWLLLVMTFLCGAFVGIMGMLFGRCRKEEKGHIIHFSLAIFAGELVWLGTGVLY